VKSVDTKSTSPSLSFKDPYTHPFSLGQLNSSSGNFLSSAWSVRLPRTSRPICDSNRLLSWLFKRHPKLTSSPSYVHLTHSSYTGPWLNRHISSRIPILRLSTQSELPSNLKISSSHVGFGARDRRGLTSAEEYRTWLTLLIQHRFFSMLCI